jgi:hypothetical protein
MDELPTSFGADTFLRFCGVLLMWPESHELGVFIALTAIIATLLIYIFAFSPSVHSLKLSREQTQHILNTYELSPLGFLPASCLRRLPLQFEPWEKLIDNLPSLMQDGTLRDSIQSLPDMSVHVTELVNWWGH